MSGMLLRLQSALGRERKAAQAMVEYALILALVSVVAIIMLTLVGSNVNDIYNNVAIRLGGAVPAP